MLQGGQKLAANYIESLNKVVASPAVPSREVVFAGDNVRLAGQIDYPATPMPLNGYPLVVILPHAGGNTRADFAHYASIVKEAGYAVFRWDKRGTGRSGGGAKGTILNDALNAYATALKQPFINTSRAVILAQNDATLMLSENFEKFAATSQPMGTLLVGSLLDAQAILAIQTRVQVIIGANDWISWQAYGKNACDAHNQVYPYGARFCVAHHADRLLIDTRQPGKRVHIGAKHIIKDWLQDLAEI